MIDESINSELMVATGDEGAAMARALELAERGRGRVSPNPLVGAVIVGEGGVIGEGHHAELGGAHAERAAIEDCRARGADPRGATMHVTLEPCAHHGRQPPCAEALAEAGIGRVVIASDDPSAKASGRGPELLREAGVEVEWAGGETARLARLLNQPFRKHARTGLPLVTLKLAMSLDGRTATGDPSSPWISGAESRALVHRWRAESDAIAAGVGTVLADDPLLTARDTDLPRQPLRVVLDTAARTPLDSQLLRSLDVSPVLVLVGEGADRDRVKALEGAGAEVAPVAGSDSAARIASALELLGGRGITSLFLEGGPTLASAFVVAQALDEARVFIAPFLLGGPDADLSRVAGPAWDSSPAAAGEDEGSRAGTGPARQSAGLARQGAVSRALDTIGDDVLVTATMKEW